MNFNKSSFLILPALLVCLCAGCSENNTCSSNFDCKSGISCDYEKHTCTCATECGDHKCGFTPALCDDPAIICGSCSSDEICNESTGTCSVCDPQCGTRKCGPTPAACDAPSATCGTCLTGMCILPQGQCGDDPTNGSGKPCKCESAQGCSIPCPTAVGSATTCITTDVEGNGFCTFACSAAGADAECTADFPGGCCEDLSEDGSGDNFCLKSDYCCETDCCGTDCFPCGGFCDIRPPDSCNSCGMICVGFSDFEAWGYCFYPCDCPNPTQDGECPGATCTDNGNCVALPNTLQTGKGACLPPGDQAMEAFCHIPDNSCADGLICINYGEVATSGNGNCTLVCDHATGDPCENPMVCEYPLPNDRWACTRPCPSHNKSECPNNGMGWQCYDIGEAGTPNYVCIPE
jgi:hypothetical protein